MNHRKDYIFQVPKFPFYSMSPGENHKIIRGPYVLRHKDRIFLVNIFQKIGP